MFSLSIFQHNLNILIINKDMFSLLIFQHNLNILIINKDMFSLFIFQHNLNILIINKDMFSLFIFQHNLNILIINKDMFHFLFFNTIFFDFNAFVPLIFRLRYSSSWSPKDSTATPTSSFVSNTFPITIYMRLDIFTGDVMTHVWFPFISVS